MFKYVYWIVFSLVAPGYLLSQSVSLPVQWKFTTGDDPAFKNETFDDHRWTDVTLPAHWEDQGFADYDGVGWYRARFSVPPHLTKTAMVLLAGIIDDADETWINGHLVGATGKFPPEDQSAWDVPRKYPIPEGVLKAENTIAIRVFDGTGGGGIYQGPLMLITQKQFDKDRRNLLKNKQSWPYLTTSNGLISAVYNASTHKVETVYPHIFSAYDSAQLVQPFILNISPNTTEAPLKVHYLENTHVIEAVYPHFSILYTASFSASDKVFYVVVRGAQEDIKNITFTSEQPDRNVEIQTLQRGSGKTFEKYFLFGFTDQYHPRSGIIAAMNRIRSKTGSLADEEVRLMKNVFQKCTFPKKISAAERALMEQSIAVLKMAQVADHEVFPLAKGQILASLRPGVWSIAWVRDAAFAITAMAKVGLWEEAKKGLEFMLLAAPTNQYKRYIHTDGKDYGIGVDYQISVTRYFGNGREESDYAGNRGPNIEIDDFGLFLQAFCQYVAASGDSLFYQKWQTVLQTKVADPILHNINEKGIIRPDSGPWEHHLPGRSFVFTAGVCSEGLQQFAALQQRYGYSAAAYSAAADRLYQGIMDNMLFENRLIKGNAQDMRPTDHYFFDGATFELFAGGPVNNKQLFQTHMAAYERELRREKGYIRFNSADTYENQEWPFASLRVAVAQSKFGNKKEARKLVDRITRLSAQNFHLIPEIITLEEEAYKGAVPMAGYGAGAYILSLFAIQ